MTAQFHQHPKCTVRDFDLGQELDNEFQSKLIFTFYLYFKRKCKRYFICMNFLVCFSSGILSYSFVGGLDNIFFVLLRLDDIDLNPPGSSGLGGSDLDGGSGRDRVYWLPHLC